MISALVVMCVSFVVPASAEVTSVGSSTIAQQFLNYYCSYHNINISNYGYIITCEFRNNQCNYYLVLFDKSITSIVATRYRPDFSCGFEVNVNGVYGGAITYNSTSSFNQQLNDNWFSSSISHSTCYFTLTDKNTYVIMTSCDSITVSGQDVTPANPNTIPAPYTVTYSPELKLGLTRKTSEYETKSIDITLTLNKDYLDWYIRRKSEWVLDQSCGKFEQYDIKTCLDTAGANIDIIDCAKSKAIYFISLSDTSKSLKTVTGNSVYTYLTEQRYSIVDKQSGKIDGSTSTATYANGLYPYFTINFNDQYKKASFYDNLTYANYQSLCSNLPSYTFSIPLENINAEKFETISALNSILTCEYTFDYDKMFENSSQSTFSKSYKEKYNVDRGPKGVSFTNDDNWNDDTTGYADYFSKSDCYTVYSEKFSFDSYPDYVPIKDNDGNEIDNIKHNPFDLALNPVKPNSYQSVDKDGNLSEKRTEDEQIKYDKDFKYSHNFANVDYTDFSSIFSTSSSYFEFLTASIRILPDWFIATFTAWFITFLTLALIKYVIQ